MFSVFHLKVKQNNLYLLHEVKYELNDFYQRF